MKLKSIDHLYPRPQLRRAQWLNLNGPWRFTYDDLNRFSHPRDVDGWQHTIEVPYAPETPRSGIGDTGFHAYLWYQRDFEAPPGDGKVLLHFGAIDYKARVWVNDEFLIEHEGGHTPFSVDISHCLRTDGHQTVTVWAEDDPHDLAKPRGKQDWQLEAHSIWYPRTSGIWQTVWAERVPETYIRHIRWTPHFERWEIGFEVFVGGQLRSGFNIRVTLKIDDNLLARDSYEVLSGEVHRRIALSDPGIDDYRNELLWSPEKPTLIDANIELWDGDRLVDTVKSYTAMRTVGIQRDRFMLNGRPYYLRLVLDQGYWPETHMTPPSAEALRTDIDRVKAMGFNGVRKHQKIEDPRFLFWADVMGLLVWEEMPSCYRFTPEAVRRLTNEWISVIERDSSHPCIVVWVPFNESWGVPNLAETPAHRNWVQALYHMTHSLDPTRPVIGNDGWESTATDIIGIHDYDSNAANLGKRYGPLVKLNELFDRRRPGGRILTLDGYPHSGQPVMLTEFGGIAYVKPRDLHAEKAWGYSRSRSEKDFLDSYTTLLEQVNGIEMFAGFCYTQLTDTFQEANGLLYADRQPKLPLSAISAATISEGIHFDPQAGTLEPVYDTEGPGHFPPVSERQDPPETDLYP